MPKTKLTSRKFKFVLYPHKFDLTVDATMDRLKAMHDKYEWIYHHSAHEICPTTDLIHVDGYYEYSSSTGPRAWATENNKFLKTFAVGYGDLQMASGTYGENIDYSEKEGRRIDIVGEPSPGQGNRSDLKEICDQLGAGTTTTEALVVDHPNLYHQYARTFHKREDIALRKRYRTDMPESIWYYGPTGAGKSHKAFEGYHPDTHYLWKDDKGWQDGYTGQPIVIINDFRGSIPYNQLLQMCDKWPFFVPRRGREPAPFLASKIIITSSLIPEQVYYNMCQTDSLEQLLRRITVVGVGLIASEV